MREHDANADATLSFNEFRSMYATITRAWTWRTARSRERVCSGRARPAERHLHRGRAQPRRRDGRHSTTPIEYDFAFTDVPGTGGFAVVKKAMHLRTKQLYAVKIVNVAHGGNSRVCRAGRRRHDHRRSGGGVLLTMSPAAATRAHAVKVR